MRIAVRHLIRQQRADDGTREIEVIADLGETVRAACTLVLSPRDAASIARMLVEPCPATVEVRPPARAGIAPEPVGSRPRVLIVDDEPVLAGILGEHLTDRGYEAEMATHGDDAVGIAVRRPPDAVLLDIMMPGVDGVTVLKRIQALELGVPVIMVTGNGDEAIARETLRLGAFDYICKPIGFDRLDDVLATALAAHGRALAPPAR